MDPQTLIDFENRHPRPGVLKDNEIIRQFHISPIRYYQALLHLMTSEEGVRLDPALAGRVRRRIEAAKRGRRAA